MKLLRWAKPASLAAGLVDVGLYRFQQIRSAHAFILYSSVSYDLATPIIRSKNATGSKLQQDS